MRVTARRSGSESCSPARLVSSALNIPPPHDRSQGQAGLVQPVSAAAKARPLGQVRRDASGSSSIRSSPFPVACNIKIVRGPFPPSSSWSGCVWYIFASIRTGRRSLIPPEQEKNGAKERQKQQKSHQKIRYQ
ncbi:hypothetical protein VTJ04DRAFT_8884 [Mycothermus thermophilus]|uniref:uncharacterized protein n=1 Tax=Humicola insolens TaxID=85995 RepID=UPI003744770F